MSGILAMFPGQGSQSVGMGSSLLKEFPLSRIVFEEAEDTIRIPLRKLCLEGPVEKLQLTSNQQPCILTLSIAIWRVLAQETSIEHVEYYAGHSLGEYSALVASNKIQLSDAVKLVHLRGQAMQDAVPFGLGGMAAVVGYDDMELSKVCQEITSNIPDSVLEIVNFNSPGQQIVSGHKNAVDALCQHLEKLSIRTVPLPVSAPFHSSLMKPASTNMAPLLKSLNFSENQQKIFANLTGEVVENYTAELLIKQIDHPVLWSKSMENAYKQGIRKFVEIGPGKVLFGLARRCVPKSGSQILHSENISSTISKINEILH